jgi:metal-responsive CopG/Arc/MetJ family transcriptional regulator
MSKIGRPGIDGQEVLVKVPQELLDEVDGLWPKAQCVSRNDFIRRALWGAVHRAKAKLAGAPA